MPNDLFNAVKAKRDLVLALFKQNPELASTDEGREQAARYFGPSAPLVLRAHQTGAQSEVAKLRADFLSRLSEPQFGIQNAVGSPAEQTAVAESGLPTPAPTPSGTIPGSTTALGGRYAATPLEGVGAERRLAVQGQRLAEMAKQPGGLGLIALSLGNEVASAVAPAGIRVVDVEVPGRDRYVQKAIVREQPDGTFASEIIPGTERPMGSGVTVNVGGKAPAATERAKLAETSANIGRIDNMLDQLRTPSFKDSLENYTGVFDQYKTRGLQTFSPESIPSDVREFFADVADYRDAILHERSGAAVMASEWERLRESLPNPPQDKPAQIIDKLKASKRTLERLEKTYGLVLTDAGFRVPDTASFRQRQRYEEALRNDPPQPMAAPSPAPGPAPAPSSVPSPDAEAEEFLRSRGLMR